MYRLLHVSAAATACRRASFPSFHLPLLQARRHCATVPSENEVRKAYKTLGVHSAASLADVKKRYVDLAKAHHPDVAASTAASSTSKMTDINDAYNTVKTFYQAGGKLSSPESAATDSSGPSASSAHSYYTAQDAAYQPWYEDMDPLMYELMWEEMRRQNEEATFAHTINNEAYFHANGPRWRQPPRHQHKQRSSSSNASSQQAGRSEDKASTTTTWPAEQVTAMVNMYQDGKSFDFIANALGKASGAAVLEEFNRWSADTQTSRRRGGNFKHTNNNGRRRRPPHRPNGFYYAESPDDIPFDLYGAMEDVDPYDGAADLENPFGYYAGEEDYEADLHGATPFYGTHQMSGGVPPYAHSGYAHRPGSARGHSHRSSSNSNINNNNRGKTSFKPSRHQRNGPSSKYSGTNNSNKRHTPFNGSASKRNHAQDSSNSSSNSNATK